LRIPNAEKPNQESRNPRNGNDTTAKVAAASDGLQGSDGVSKQ
jgi:hypothetical protein